MVQKPQFVQASKSRTIKHRKLKQLSRYGNFPEQAQAAGLSKYDTSDLLTDVEAFFLAKHYPGRINAPFMKNLSASNYKTGIVSCITPISQCNDNDSLSVANLGTRRYLVIMYLPVISFASAKPASTYRPSGLYMIQVDDPTTPIFNFEDIAGDSNKNWSMIELYGSDMDSIASFGFIWSSQLAITPTVSTANISGNYARGFMPLSTLLEKSSDPASLVFSVDMLKRNAYHNQKVPQNRPMYLQSAVVDAEGLTACRTYLDPNAISETWRRLSNECVSYLVID